MSPPRSPRRPPSLLIGIAAFASLAVAAGAALAPHLGGPPGLSVPSPSAVAGTADPNDSGTGVRPGPASPVPSAFPTAVLPTPGSAVPSGSPRQGVVAVRVRIDRLSIDLPIIEGDGVDAPLAHVAHHPRTAWPDSGSNVFLYGHAQEGTLRSLWDVSVGDEVVITLVDGSSRSYAVTQVRPRTPWNATELLDPTPTERLTLQTSTGTEATSPRFVAIAERRP